jgi:hypothetical protein
MRAPSPQHRRPIAHGRGRSAVVGGVLFAAASACNAILGYTANYELVEDAGVDGATPDVLSESGGEDVAADATSDANSEGGPRDADAARPDNEIPDASDASAPDDAGQDADADADAGGPPTLGVPCGAVVCEPPRGCCYAGNPVASLPTGCAMGPALCPPSPVGGFLACDGPEDCASGDVCCATPDLALGPGYWKTQCIRPDGCFGAFACHTSDEQCDCKPADAGGMPGPGPACPPITTCDGKCM